MWKKQLAAFLALSLLFAPSLAFSEPSPSRALATLSDAEVEALLTEARDRLAKSYETINQQSMQLDRSNQIIDRQSIQLEKSMKVIEKQSIELTLLLIGCAVLGLAATAEGISLAIR